MRVLLVFAPIALFASFVLVRAVGKRPLTRRGLDIGVALLLLGYLSVTAGLGLFWVARMDLPVFDWHYLFGYALLLVAAAHVSLQLRGLVRFFRSRARAPASERPGGTRTQPGAAVALLGVVTLLAVAGWFLRSPERASAPGVPPAATQAPPADAAPLVDKLYRESSYSRRGLLRSAGLVPEKPPETKPYAGRARLELPPAPPTAKVTLAAALDAFLPPARPAVPATLDRVSALLFHANGVTAEGPGYRLRAAASSGALYPTDLYLVADRVDGLAPGAYYYDGPAHQLAGVRGAEAAAAVRAALPALPVVASAPLLLVFGSTFDRTAWKYNVRTYRYLGLDAGHVALNVAAAARALELDCAPVPVFDDAAVGAALGLDPRQEAALLVFACGAGTTAVHPPVSPRQRRAVLPDDADGIELTRLSSSLTSVGLDDGFTWLTVPPAPRPPPPLGLPPRLPSERDLFAVIRERRSYREFAAREVSREAFAAVLASAALPFGWLRSAPLVELFVVVSAVSGVAPGSYRYDAERHALSAPLRRGALQIEEAGLDQAVLGRAAFVLSWALVEERVGKTEGARDFRHACLEAGLSGEAAYLAAAAAELGICGVGAFYDEEVNALFASPSGSPRVIYLAGVGARSD